MKTLFCLFLIAFTITIDSVEEEKVDMIVYSYNRPMQLYALLESTQIFVTGLGEVNVIYRADNAYESAYEQVKREFPDVIFFKQGVNPDKDFKPMTLSAVFGSPNKYVVFGVDDIIVKDYVDLSQCIQNLEKTKAYGFYLRLGNHITHCYPTNRSQSIPPLRHIGEQVYAWKFNEGDLDWGYPHTVDMTIYRKEDIKRDLTDRRYTNPTGLEAGWKHDVADLEGLCFSDSKIVNIPANRVQQIEPNRSMNGDPIMLLEKFNEGYKIDVSCFHKIRHHSPHIEADFRFIKRTEKRQKPLKEERFGMPIEALSIAYRYLPNNPIVIEAGAYEGVESVAIAKKWPEGQIYSFEPIPELYNRMTSTIKGYSNIKTYPYAIGDIVGNTTMYVSEYPSQPGVPSQSSSLLEPKEHLKYSDVKFPKKISVPITTFDAWAKENKIDHVDLMWLDMQGYELNALKACPELLKTVKVLLTEVEHVEAYAGQPLFDEVKTWLEAQGFVLLARNYYIDWMEDALFVRKELIESDLLNNVELSLSNNIEGYDNGDMHTNGELFVITNFIQDGDVVFDVGANKGEWTKAVCFCKKVRRVYVFEPIPDVFKTLSNQFNQENIALFNQALGGAKESLKLQYYVNNSALSTFFDRTATLVNFITESPQIVTVPVETLDNFVKDQAISKIDFLKIDTEGSELNVLMGAQQSLAQGRIRQIQFEYGGTYKDAKITLRQVYTLLRKNGFKIFRIASDKLIPISSWNEALENYRYSNYLAIKEI